MVIPTSCTIYGVFVIILKSTSIQGVSFILSLSPTVTQPVPFSDKPRSTIFFRRDFSIVNPSLIFLPSLLTYLTLFWTLGSEDPSPRGNGVVSLCGTQYTIFSINLVTVSASSEW